VNKLRHRLEAQAKMLSSVGAAPYGQPRG